MAIKLNGVEITSNKLNGSDVSEEKLNGTTVFTSAPPIATSWNTTALNGPLTASFETQAFIIDGAVVGCGFGSVDLPSATNYVVGTIVRGRQNTFSGTCPTWIYFIAV